MDIGCSEPFSLVDTLGDAVIIREWVLQKLPKDEFSVSNAIILSKSIRFPLFVDPQVKLFVVFRNIAGPLLSVNSTKKNNNMKCFLRHVKSEIRIL